MTTNNRELQTTQLATNAEDDTSIAIDSSDVIHIIIILVQQVVI